MLKENPEIKINYAKLDYVKIYQKSYLLVDSNN